MPPESNPFREELARRAAPPSSTANPFRAELERRAKTPAANVVFRERMARTALDNLMAGPSASGELLADAINFGRAGVQRAATAGVRNLQRVLPFTEPAPTTPTLGDLYKQKSANEGLVQTALRSIPRPTTRTVGAAASSIPALVPGGESPSEAYQRNLDAGMAEDVAMRAAHPTAALAGDVSGDILSLFVGRRSTGADKLVQRAETRLAGRASVKAAESLADDLNKIATGASMQRLARGGVRSLEAGIEAAALDILKDPNADPIETAALAAGGQLVGSGTLGGAQGLLSGGPASAGLKITVAAVSTMGLLQLLKSATPGGRDRVLESIESGYDKVALALGAGVASAAIGATRYGRGNAALSDQTRAFLDGVGTVHRGTVLSVLTDWTEGDDKDRATIERVLTAISEDPSYSGETKAERAIVRRLKDGAALKPETMKTGGGF